ncbi:MAG: hypothetical protein ACRDXX_02470 [Stackebrandtia sp.]
MNVSTTEPRAGLGGTGFLVLLALAAVHLGIAFAALGSLLADAVQTDPGQVANLIMSLSTMAIGAVFGGAVAGHLAVVAAAHGQSPRFARLPRILLAAWGGAAVGLIAAAVAYATFSSTPAVAAIIAGVAGVSSVLGSLLAAPRHDSVVAASLIATGVLLVLMFLRGWFRSDLADLLLRDGDAYRWISILAGVAAGVGVGLTAYAALRRRRATVGLYGYLAAGAAPGALWVISEISVRVGGAALLSTTDEIDALSDLMLGQSLDAQLNGGLAALFAGATTAVLAFGMLANGKPVSRGKAKQTAEKQSAKAGPDVKPDKAKQNGKAEAAKAARPRQKQTEDADKPAETVDAEPSESKASD